MWDADGAVNHRVKGDNIVIGSWVKWISNLVGVTPHAKYTQISVLKLSDRPTARLITLDANGHL